MYTATEFSGTYCENLWLPTLADLRQLSTGEGGRVGGCAGDDARGDQRAAAIPDRFSDQMLHSSLDLQGELVLAVKTFIDGNSAGWALSADWAELYPSFRIDLGSSKIGFA